MAVVSFNELPNSGRLWVYGAARPFGEHQIAALNQSMRSFLEHWTAHKREMATAWQLQYNQFIFIAVDESMTAASGCSIDGMVHHLRSLEGEFGMDIVNSHARIFYRDQDSAIQSVSRAAFRELAASGEVDENTIVFNNTIQTVGELRQGKWEVPMKESWHIEAFGTLV